jgi:hypothetical protein
VAAKLEIIGPDGPRQAAVPAAATFELGSDPTADIVVVGTGIQPRHLRFVAIANGYRVEAVRAGATVRVAGEDLFCKDLRRGDVVELGPYRLRWSDDAPLATSAAPESRSHPARRALARAPDSSAPTVRRLRARRPAWWPAVAVFVVVLLTAFGLYRHFRGSTWPASPKHYVDLARAQFGNSEPQRALDTLSFALREATGAVREEALRLEAEIRRVQIEVAELPKLRIARDEHDLLLGFVGRYLRDGAARPAARELVRSVDQWLERHRELCERFEDGRPLVQTLAAERTRYLALAELATPDTAADVVFAARSRLRFQWRDYRGAMARLEAFLQQHPGDAEVEAECAKLRSEGREWLLDKLRFIDQLLGRGDRNNAERELAQLERWSVLPEWAPLVAERQRRLGDGR